MPKHHEAREGLDTRKPPLDTRSLRKALAFFLREELPDGGTVGGCKHGVYAFFDYDGEPIYVGQTVENLSTRIGRHLRGMRSDAVAKGVLDPYEVRSIKVWPVLSEVLRGKSQAEVTRHLNDLEATVFHQLIRQSRFGEILNEKPPSGSGRRGTVLPTPFGTDLIAPEVAAFRSHPDVRLARRAATIARLAQMIAERDVKPALRRVLLVQAKRLAWLAEQRAQAFAGSKKRG